MYCKLKRIDSKHLFCTICGRILREDATPDVVHIYCPKKLTPEQLAERESIRAEQEERAKREAEALRPEGEKLGWTFAMVCRYAAALKKWVAAGRPTRTDKEVMTIENICKACEKYESESGRCRVCGCKITTPGIAILSKARLATESCPKELW